MHISNEITFDNMPAMVVIKQRLSKARNQYFTFIGKEGAIYIKDYLDERRKNGEELCYDSNY